MGIGRKNFLKLIGIAGAGLVLDPYLSVIINNDFYINKKLGVSFIKPSGWDFIKVRDFGKLKEKQILYCDNELSNDEIWKDLEDPICVITKYFEDVPEYRGIFSPTITLNITPKKDMEVLGYNTFDDVITVSEFGAAEILKDFKVLHIYDPYYVDNIEYREFDTEYIFEHIEMKNPVKVELTVVKVLYKDFYYDFNLHQSRMENQIAIQEFDKFKRSIKFL